MVPGVRRLSLEQRREEAEMRGEGRGGSAVCKAPNRLEPDRPFVSLPLVSSTGSH